MRERWEATEQKKKESKKRVRLSARACPHACGHVDLGSSDGMQAAGTTRAQQRWQRQRRWQRQ
eukprot:5899675-Pleurochrysis_carterae.AAC.2